MAPHRETPKMTELDLLLLCEGVHSYSDMMAHCEAAASADSSETMRHRIAEMLHGLAQRIDGDSSDPAAGHHS